MARFTILLALFSWSLINSVSAGPLLPRQGCQSGATTTDANGQTLTCGGDGQYYDGNGQPAQPGGGANPSTQTGQDGGQPSPVSTQPNTGGTGGTTGAGGPPAGYSVGWSTVSNDINLFAQPDRNFELMLLLYLARQ